MTSADFGNYPTGGFPSMIGGFAVAALKAEASLSPKPGLVDEFHDGAHRDMGYALFLASAESLGPVFADCARAGLEFRGPSLCGLLSVLRPIGLQGENAMLSATGGVNTHKGAIFCIGLLCAAAGFALSRRMSEPAGNRIPQEGTDSASIGNSLCHISGGICKGLVETELEGKLVSRAFPGSETAGTRLYLTYGVRGARGQAEDSWPVVRCQILPLLRASRGKGHHMERTARLHALLGSMAVLEDSCVLSRGGLTGLSIVREGAAGVLALGGAETADGIKALGLFDAELCEKSLSPGGSADMLAAGIFIDAIERENLPFQLTNRDFLQAGGFAGL